MICPNCKKEYKPVLQRPDGDNRCIQDIYPKSTPTEREQLVSGICSDKCWDEFLGLEEDDFDGDKGSDKLCDCGAPCEHNEIQNMCGNCHCLLYEDSLKGFHHLLSEQEIRELY